MTIRHFITGFYLLVSVLIFSFSANAQYLSSKGARAAGMAGTSLLNKDVWANYNNQAALAMTKGVAGGVYFSNRFNMNALSDKAAAFSLKTDRFGALGLSYTYFGNETFRTGKAGLAYAKQLGKRFYAGMQINYLSNYIAGDYGKKSTITGEFGLIAEPVENLMVGAYVSNPWRAKLTEAVYEEYQKTEFRLAAGYHFSEHVLFAAQAEKDIDREGVTFRSGIDYTLVAGLSLRTGVGFSNNYTEYSFGAGYNWNNLEFDIAFSNHPALGFTPHVSISYQFKKTKTGE